MTRERERERERRGGGAFCFRKNYLNPSYTQRARPLVCHNSEFHANRIDQTAI